MTQYAKLSTAAAASLQFVRGLQNAETHEKVRDEVFGQAKALFGIPERHRVKVELNPEQEDYLFIVRKKDGTKYELDPSTGRWVQAQPLPKADGKVFVAVPLDEVRSLAVDLVYQDGQETLAAGDLPGELDATKDFLVHGDVMYVKVDEDDLNVET